VQSAAAKGHIDVSRATVRRGLERPLSIDIVTTQRTYVVAADRPGDLAKCACGVCGATARTDAHGRWLRALSKVVPAAEDVVAWLAELETAQVWLPCWSPPPHV
jgi:hypothetical protein